MLLLWRCRVLLLSSKVTSWVIGSLTTSSTEHALARPQLKIPLPEAAKQRTAEFRTTYLSEMVRIARGSTGNVFVFRRAE